MILFGVIDLKCLQMMTTGQVEGRDPDYGRRFPMTAGWVHCIFWILARVRKSIENSNNSVYSRHSFCMASACFWLRVSSKESGCSLQYWDGMLNHDAMLDCDVLNHDVVWWALITMVLDHNGTRLQWCKITITMVCLSHHQWVVMT